MITPHIDVQYKWLLQGILDHGYETEPAERQDTGTRQINHHALEIDLRQGFPLLTTKEVDFKNIVVELLWFMRGDTNIKYLVENGCNIWNADAYKFYLHKCKERDVSEIMTKERFVEVIKKDAEPFDTGGGYRLGDLGPVYGAQWRRRERYWAVDGGSNIDYEEIDQLTNLVYEIQHTITTGYNNRRLLVDAWNPAEIKEMALPPCHTGFEVILEPIPTATRISEYEARGIIPTPKYYLNLKWHQRSVDTFLGLPYNIASYALLTHILAMMTNTVPKMLYGDLSRVHIYNNHIEQVKEQLGREEKKLPYLMMDLKAMRGMRNAIEEKVVSETWDSLDISDFGIGEYDPHPPIRAKMVS